MPTGMTGLEGVVTQVAWLAHAIRTANEVPPNQTSLSLSGMSEFHWCVYPAWIGGVGKLIKDGYARLPRGIPMTSDIALECLVY